MVLSPIHDTPIERWSVGLPCLRVSGSALCVTGGRPSWHSPIYFGVLAGPTRIALSVVGLSGTDGLVASVLAYIGCMVLAFALAAWIRNRGERVSRICSGLLGNLGFTLTVVTAAVTVVSTPPRQFISWSLVIPLTAIILMLALNLIGEILARRFPEQPTSPDAGAPDGGTDGEGGMSTGGTGAMAASAVPDRGLRVTLINSDK